MEWIIAKEKMPGPYDGFVLAVCYGRFGNKILDAAVELAEYDPDSGEWILEFWPMADNIQVTHWMPLPEPPGEEQANE